MATRSIRAGSISGRLRLRLPERIPDLRTPWLRLFDLLWLPALLLAIVGPIGGIWYRLTSPGENSALMLGSRVGVVLARDDLTRVRFPVGSAARAAGVQAGDHIVAIDGIPVSPIVPLSLSASNHGTDTDYALFSPIIEGTQPIEFDFTLRSATGQRKQFYVTAGEQHIEQAAERLGISPSLLSVVDLVQILTFPFLLLAAWILHRRRREDLISSVLSLAILLTLATEQPSSAFLTFVASVPGWLHQRLYDVGNICLLAGILLFPFGQLRPRISLAFVGVLPVLFFLSGDDYRFALIAFMAAGILTLFARLRSTAAGAERQQIKWALLGFAGYALFLTVALASDEAKLHTGSFAGQLSIEILASLSFGLAFVSLMAGLIIALLRYRLYDAEAVISRSANFALITLGLATIFAGVSDGLKQLIYNYYGNSNSEGPIIFAAAFATVLVNPLQERIHRWSEKRFQRNLMILRDDLPECVRDLRETAKLEELLHEVLLRVENGVRAVRTAVVVDGRVAAARGVASREVESWLASDRAASRHDRLCEVADNHFPVRVPLTPGHDGGVPLGTLLVGGRPDGSIISKSEQRALVEVAEPIARAIRIVIKRESLEQKIADAIAKNANRIAAIEAALLPSGSSGTHTPPKRRKFTSS